MVRKTKGRGAAILRREVAYTRLRTNIVRGLISPGASLREEELSKALGVSRTPLREAIRRLCEEGLVEVLPYRGARVVNLDSKQMREVFEAREAIEGMAARLAANRVQKSVLDELKRSLKTRLDEVNKPLSSYRPATVDFHQVVLEVSGNALLMDLAKRLYARIVIARVAAGTFRGRVVETAREHMEIFEAIRIRDGNRAEALMRQHIHRTWENLSSYLEESGRASNNNIWISRTS